MTLCLSGFFKMERVPEERPKLMFWFWLGFLGITGTLFALGWTGLDEPLIMLESVCSCDRGRSPLRSEFRVGSRSRSVSWRTGERPSSIWLTLTTYLLCSDASSIGFPLTSILGLSRPSIDFPSSTGLLTTLILGWSSRSLSSALSTLFISAFFDLRVFLRLTLCLKLF